MARAITRSASRATTRRRTIALVLAFATAASFLGASDVTALSPADTAPTFTDDANSATNSTTSTIIATAVPPAETRALPRAGPTVVGPGDPLGLILDRRMLDALTLATDVVAVVRCRVPANTTEGFYVARVQAGATDIAPDAVALWLKRHVRPYFTEASGGRMQMSFRSEGTVDLEPSDGPQQCLAKARARAVSPYTNVIAYDTTSYVGGFGGNGSMRCEVGAVRVCNFVANTGVPPSSSNRGTWVGGGAVGTVAWAGIRVVTHELGHTLGWPHSFARSDKPYENMYDLMSGQVPCEPSATTCVRDAQHTLAINRYTSGWIDPQQVKVLESGTTTVQLAAPNAPGVQFAAIRLSKNTFLTVEARPTLGRDVSLPFGGVAVHRINTGDCVKDTFVSCKVGLRRVQRTASSDAARSDHVIIPGASRTFGGALIEVLRTTNTGFQVRITVG
jgi:hypothetical protein